MKGENKYESLTETEWFTAQLLPASLNLTLITTPGPSPKKYTLSLNPSCPSQALLSVFQSCSQLLAFISSGKDYSFDPSTGIFTLKWKIMGSCYERDVEFAGRMEEVGLQAIDGLRIENAVLKRKIRMYEGSRMKRSSFNQFEQMKITHQEKKNMTEENKESIEKEPTSESKSCQLVEALSPGPEKNQKVKRRTKGIRNKVKAEQWEKNEQSFAPEVKKTRGRRKKVDTNANQMPTPETMDISPPTSTSSYNSVKICFENGDYYYGELKDNLYHGHGLYFSPSNGTFEGEWQNGKANGYGISKDPSGNQHSGFYINDKRNGKGIDIYVNGEKYTGEFQNDQKCGQGKYVYANGDCYEGMWKNDMYHGFGKESYHDGTSFQGTWTADEKDGEGVFTNLEGKRWKQVWHKGLKVQESELSNK